MRGGHLPCGSPRCNFATVSALGLTPAIFLRPQRLITIKDLPFEEEQHMKNIVNQVGAQRAALGTGLEVGGARATTVLLERGE